MICTRPFCKIEIKVSEHPSTNHPIGKETSEHFLLKCPRSFGQKTTIKFTDIVLFSNKYVWIITKHIKCTLVITKKIKLTIHMKTCYSNLFTDNHCRGMNNFLGFSGFSGIFGIFWDSLGFLGFLGFSGFMGFSRISGFLGIFWDFWGFFFGILF